MTFYAQLLRTHQLLSKKAFLLSILLEIHTFYVCLSTIETRFYTDSKPEETTEGPKVTAFNARYGLLGPYWFEKAKPVKRSLSMLPRYGDVFKNLTPDDFYDDLSKPSLKANSEWPGSSKMGFHLILPMMTLLLISFSTCFFYKYMKFRIQARLCLA